MRYRTVLFSPANMPTRVRRLLEANSDVVVLDLEDGVGVDQKANARAALRAFAAELREGSPQLAVFARINDTRSEFYADDLLALGPELTGVVLPKVEHTEDLADLRQALAERHLNQLQVMAGVETALGVHQAAQFLAPGHAESVYFGAEDFTADMGGVRSREGTEVLYARSQVALAARLAGVVAIDQIVADFEDDELFGLDAQMGRSLGYSGKMCIHPRQVALGRAAFTPSAKQLAEARELLAAFQRGLAAGEGVIRFRGQMIDEPLAKRAAALLALVEETDAHNDGDNS
jgi:citrate lyase subunit beta/citryl-CoA lyase